MKNKTNLSFVHSRFACLFFIVHFKADLPIYFIF